MQVTGQEHCGAWGDVSGGRLLWGKPRMPIRAMPQETCPVIMVLCSRRVQIQSKTQEHSMNEIHKILRAVSKCSKCASMKGHRKFPVHSHGNMSSNYMLVSEAPSKASLSEGKYWMGVGGKLLRSALSPFNRELEDLFYLTDIVKCWPSTAGENRPPFGLEMKHCFPFLKREVHAIEPCLILSFGKSSSELLLRRSVTMRDSHGKLYTDSAGTQVLVLYHPSGIDRFMKRSIYVRQLQAVFGRILANDIDGITAVFSSDEDQVVSVDDKCDTSCECENMPCSSLDNISFTLPDMGNTITDKDMLHNQLRVTAAFKKHFPNANCTLQFYHERRHYQVSFIHGGKRSHILRLGSSLMKLLRLNFKSNVQITKCGQTTYQIEVIDK